MRTLILTALALLATATDLHAQPRAWGRRPLPSPYAQTAVLPPPRYPRLAAFALPAFGDSPYGYRLPGYDSGRPLARVLPAAYVVASNVLSFVNPVAVYASFNALPVAVGAAHVLLNGSPTPGYPGQTLLFIANPFAAEARARLSQGVGLFGRAQPLP